MVITRSVRVAPIVTAGAPVPFSCTLFEPAIDWDLRFWRFDNSADPVTAPAAFAARLREIPDRTGRVTRLSYLTSRAIAEGLPNDRVAVRAEGMVELPRIRRRSHEADRRASPNPDRVF
jgi:hypothetical protein